ncbi:MAG TPA: N(4)-(beta-N-acetylglucosaminyl)-L-asparaginase [Gemmatales bacterium]|nr:N(4)-(beta-N-acetylglucosaminyl)-L-asparaginase [Gemmatales bacterium]
MSAKVSRRRFMTTTALAASTATTVSQAAPLLYIPRAVKPVVISADNGHLYRNRGTQTCVEKAFSLLTQGSDVLDALIAGVNICELDPEDDSVGFGGLPNANGVVQLDASVMHGPKRRAGAVACLEGVRTPSLVARAVMDHTDHHLLVGKDAQVFARQMGFKVEDDLNTEHSRQKWLEWKRRTDPHHYPDPARRAEAGMEAALQMCREGLLNYDHLFGTINCNGINSQGDLAGVTTTSGLAWKIPGRLGDSPILGAGLYVDNEIGAAGSTGRGEANLYGLSSFLIIEELRRGRSPKDAGMLALRRIKSATIERRLKNRRGLPRFNVKFYILNKAGEYAGVSMYPASGLKPHHYGQFAICNEHGAKLIDCDALLEGSPLDENN